jgi:hypothetical protein
MANDQDPDTTIVRTAGDVRPKLFTHKAFEIPDIAGMALRAALYRSHRPGYEVAEFFNGAAIFVGPEP